MPQPDTPSLPKPTRRCPTDFTPDATTVLWAKTNFPSIDLFACLDTLKDYEFKRTYHDWNTVLRNWIRREAKFQYERMVRTRPDPPPPGRPPQPPTQPERGDFEHVLKDLAAQSATPEWARAHLMLFRSGATRDGQEERAAQMCEQFAQQYPEDADAWRMEAARYRQRTRNA